ncbi:MAG: hypothetical protein ACLR6J_06130 [Parabacteroides merdae]
MNNTPGTNARPSRPNDDRKPRLRKPVKAEISEEDVQKQVKRDLGSVWTIKEIRIIKVPSTVATNAMPSRSVNTN